MKTKPRPRKIWGIMAALALLLAGGARAQDFTLEWSAVAAGGGQSSGGDFTLDGSISPADAGIMSGGDFELDGGFWSIIAALDTPGAPPLSLNVSGAQVALSWPASAGTGFVLEEATALAAAPGATAWNALNLTAQFTNGLEVIQLPLTNGNRFYRLRSL